MPPWAGRPSRWSPPDRRPAPGPLQQPLTDDGTALQDVVEDTQTPPPEVLVAAAQVRRGVDACLSHLTAREALIVRWRYGLDADEPQTLQAIGDVLGLSRERVRQLEQQAFAKLRQLPQSAGPGREQRGTLSIKESTREEGNGVAKLTGREKTWGSEGGQPDPGAGKGRAEGQGGGRRGGGGKSAAKKGGATQQPPEGGGGPQEPLDT